MRLPYRNTYFTTLAIDKFINIFENFPETNFIILDSFNNLVSRDIVEIYAFVIMRNHIHIVWQVLDQNHIDQVITSFKRFTGKSIAKYLSNIDSEYLNYFKSKRKDREFKIWKLTKGNILVYNHKMLGIKIRYIHNNPTKGKYKKVDDCTEFYFSSANAYAKQSTNFRFLNILQEVTPWS